MFPVHAKCVTFDAGWSMERADAAASLEIGAVYTIRSMTVGQSDSYLEFYELPGSWSTVFFEAFYPGLDDYDDMIAEDQ